MISKLYLVDTCIWRDFYEDRFGKSGRPIGKYASDLFMKILKKKYKILFSEGLVWELKKDYSEEQINDMLNLLFLNNILIRIEIIEKEYLEGKEDILRKNQIPKRLVGVSSQNKAIDDYIGSTIKNLTQGY